MRFAKVWNYFFPLLILCLFLISSTAQSQFDRDYKIALGLSTVKLMGENPGGFRIFRFPDSNKPLGGSFDQSQPGIELRLTMPIDEGQTFRFPVGIDYQFYSAKEVAAAGPYYVKLHHRLDVLSAYFGIHWVFVKFPLANALGYIGLEARTSYINGVSLEWERVFTVYDIPTIKGDYPTKYSGKVNALRFGGSLRIGIEGDLVDRFQINPSVAFSIMNLLNRNNDRGELITFSKRDESGESFVYNYHISILIQYKL